MRYTYTDTPRSSQLLGMNFRKHAPLGTGFKHPGCLFGSKEALVAENINIVRQLLTSDFGNHLVDNKAYILLVAIGPAHSMSTKEGGNHTHGKRIAETTDNTQHFKFVVKVQTITALNFQTPGTLMHNLYGTL